MNENDARIEQFKSEIEDLNLRGSSSDGEKRLLGLGIAMAVAGLLLAVYGGIQVMNSGGSPADQRAFTATGSFIGIALIIAGAALFIRYSLARYMRFWLIRLTYESRANTDRIVDAVERAAGIERTTVAPQPVIAEAPSTTPPPIPTATPPVA